MLEPHDHEDIGALNHHYRNLIRAGLFPTDYGISRSTPSLDLKAQAPARWNQNPYIVIHLKKKRAFLRLTGREHASLQPLSPRPIPARSLRPYARMLVYSHLKNAASIAPISLGIVRSYHHDGELSESALKNRLKSALLSRRTKNALDALPIQMEPRH